MEFLSGFVLEERWERIRQVSANRTRYLTLILEDIHYAQNASAVVRSCDCFGIQDLHFIHNIPVEGQTKIRSHVTQGSDKWIDIHRYFIRDNVGTEKTTKKAISGLKKTGYRIIATTPDRNALHLEQLDIGQGPMAVIMGNEQRGVTGSAASAADEFVTIPMYGFAESYNISVSAALLLHSLVTRLHESRIEWQLPEQDLHSLRFKWLMKTIPKAKEILRVYEQSF